MYEELYAQNRGLLITMVRRYARVCAKDRAVSEEDLLQAGFLGLMRASQSYDPTGGRSWSSWAAWHMKREFERALGLRDGHFTQAHSGADTLDRPLVTKDGEYAPRSELLVDDSLPPTDEGLIRDELRRGVREAVDRLADDGQRRAVRLRWLEERSCRETAGALGISQRQAQYLSDRGCINLARDWRLRRLADLDDRTRFHAHKGVAAFNRDWTSVTEGAALWRIEQQRKNQT